MNIAFFFPKEKNSTILLTNPQKRQKFRPIGDPQLASFLISFFVYVTDME